MNKKQKKKGMWFTRTLLCGVYYSGTGNLSDLQYFAVYVHHFYSFTDYTDMNPTNLHFVAFQNYIKVFQTPLMRIAIKNSLIYAILLTGFQVILGLPIAAVLNKS